MLISFYLTKQVEQVTESYYQLRLVVVIKDVIYKYKFIMLRMKFGAH